MTTSTGNSDAHNQAYEQGHQIRHVHPNFHQHFKKGKNPKKGRDIGTIFETRNILI
jgi:hypothetical protein